jgi:hypothetical protein
VEELEAFRTAETYRLKFFPSEFTSEKRREILPFCSEGEAGRPGRLSLCEGDILVVDVTDGRVVIMSTDYAAVLNAGKQGYRRDRALMLAIC